MDKLGFDQQALIENTLIFITETFKGAEGGHDLLHTLRVRHNALTIAKEEKCDVLVVELAALLHDIADSKFHEGNDAIGPEKARKFLQTNNCPNNITDNVVSIIENVSFKGGKTVKTHDSIELDIVQDADRLEAIGAIGIARAFNYGGYKARALFDQNILPNLNMTKKEYKNSTAPTINHFYEKLLLLKNLMNTDSGKRIAQNRHDFLVTFLEQFYKESGFDQRLTAFDLNNFY